MNGPVDRDRPDGADTPMACRPGCAACCVVISISSPLPGHPCGKPAGVRCVNLDPDGLCALYGSDAYPTVCRNFCPDPAFCGLVDDEAYERLAELERITRP